MYIYIYIKLTLKIPGDILLTRCSLSLLCALYPVNAPVCFNNNNASYACLDVR